jgi:type III pantothenate kinase
MLLAIDIGNTNIVLALYKGDKLFRIERIPSHPKRIPHPATLIKGETIRGAIISSVVPSLTKKITKLLNDLEINPVKIVSIQDIENFGIKIKVKNKAEVGRDRLVNAVSVIKKYRLPAVVVDFGTATTFDVISKKQEYLGGAIAPGMGLARDALYQKTAKLPRIKIKPPNRIIGNDTKSAMQSGLVYGYVSMVEGMVKRIEKKLKAKPIVIATGGYAKLIGKYTKIFAVVDPYLTLEGLRLLANQ